MNIIDLSSIEQLEQFLADAQTIGLVAASSKVAIYHDIQRMPVFFNTFPD